jgi:hypothetical protein
MGMNLLDGGKAMTVTVVQGGAIRGPIAPNRAQHAAAKRAIELIAYADLWGGKRTIHTDPPHATRAQQVCRLDEQGNFNRAGFNWSNLQVQIGDSTCAHAEVSAQTANNDVQNQVGVRNRVVSALNQSLDSGNTFVVSGTSP